MTAGFTAHGKFTALIDWCRKHFGKGELSQLDSAELDRMAQELNMSRDDLIALTRATDHDLSLMERTAALHGIDVATLKAQLPGVVREMEVACCKCGDKRMCRHDQQIGADADTIDQYCPNAETMKALARG